MSNDAKKIFGDLLAEMLSKRVTSRLKIKSTKDTIKVFSDRWKKTLGHLEFVYLGGQKAYYLAISATSDEFSEFISNMNPPYKSNKPDGFNHHFSMSTLMENRGVFSRSGGTIYLPSKPEHISETISHIENVLNSTYIPLLERFVRFSPELVGDILANPDYYSYPIPLVVFALKANSLHSDFIKTNINRKAIKNSEFDKKILNEI